MTILFTTDSLDRGGKERQLSILRNRLALVGSIVYVVTESVDVDKSFINEYNIDNNKIFISKNIWDFNKLIKKLKPDVVVTWDIKSSIISLLYLIVFRYKLINGSIRHGVRLFKISHLIRTFICQLSPYVMANSHAGLKTNNLKPGKRRFVLYNGVETKFYNKLAKTSVEELRRKFIPDYNEIPGFIFISVANFVPYKDYATVLKVLARLKGDFMFYYFILGDGPMREEIEKSIKAFELEKRVILVGRTENVRDYLFSSDLMIHSSRGEGVSNAILEGMFAGLPVIATNVGGIPETVFPASSKLFTYKDHEALYKCLLKSRELKSSFNPNAEDYMKHLAKFSVEAMVKRFEEILDIVTKEKS